MGANVAGIAVDKEPLSAHIGNRLGAAVDFPGLVGCRTRTVSFIDESHDRLFTSGAKVKLHSLANPATTESI